MMGETIKVSENVISWSSQFSKCWLRALSRNLWSRKMAGLRILKDETFLRPVAECANLGRVQNTAVFHPMFLLPSQDDGQKAVTG